MAYKDKPIRGYKKTEMLYADRGMMKWKGMLLADHTEHIVQYSKEKLKKFTSLVEQDEQALEQLDNLLKYALQFHLKVQVRTTRLEAVIEGTLENLKEESMIIENNTEIIVIFYNEIVSITV